MRWGACLSAVVILAVAAGAHAQPPPDPDALDQHGIALRRQRRDAEALEEFRRSYALRPTPRTLAQIGFAEQALGRWVEAAEDLRVALQAPADPWIERNREILLAGLADVEQHLGRIDIETNVPGAELWVNGSRAATLPLAEPLRVEAGSIVIEVRADGYARARRMTSVEPGGSAREIIPLVPLAQSPPLVEPKPKTLLAGPHAAEALTAHGHAAHDPTKRPNAPLRAASWVAFGAGIVGLAAGAYFGVQALNAKNARDSNSHCTGQICDSSGVALDGDARRDRDRSTAWLVFGFLTAGGGGLLWTLGGSW
jgi:hypothetical protein